MKTEMTAKEAAEYLHMSERTIRRWISAGRIPARKLAPNRYAINAADLPVRHRKPDMSAQVATQTQRIEELERENRLLRAKLLSHTPPAASPPSVSSTPTPRPSAQEHEQRPPLPSLTYASTSTDASAGGETVDTGQVIAGVRVYLYRRTPGDDLAIGKGTAAKLAIAHGASASAEKKWTWTDHDRRSLGSTLLYARNKTTAYHAGAWHSCHDPKCPCLNLDDQDVADPIFTHAG